jgi:hypothetical protein
MKQLQTTDPIMYKLPGQVIQSHKTCPNISARLTGITIRTRLKVDEIPKQMPFT